MPIEIPYSLLIRDGDVAWTCGQVPLDGDSRVVSPDDLVAQTRVVSDHIEEILHLGALPNAAIGKLVLYCVSRRDIDKKRMIEAFRARFGSRPILSPIAVPHFYYQGLLLEVDVFASAVQGRTVEKSNDTARVQLVDGGAITWASPCTSTDSASTPSSNPPPTTWAAARQMNCTTTWRCVTATRKNPDRPRPARRYSALPATTVESPWMFWRYAVERPSYSGKVSPEPPISAGKSFIFSRPSFMGRTVDS